MIKIIIIFVLIAFSGVITTKGEVYDYSSLAMFYFSSQLIKSSQMNQEEIWKDVKNYEGVYQVSSIGRIRSLERKVRKGRGYRTIYEKIIRQNISTTGYSHVSLSLRGKAKTRTVHQLVVEAFLNHSPVGYELVVNHKDFNKPNNHLSNLEIVTQRDNTNQKHLKSTSKYIGVHWNKLKGKWESSIWVDGKAKHLGVFTDEHKAHLAYQNEKLRL